MDDKRLRKLRADLDGLKQQKTITHGEAISIATRIGRTEVSRGKHRTFVFPDKVPDRPPLTIPVHGQSELKRGTAKSILAHIDDDLDAIADHYGLSD
jgi:hypothetical protein